MQIAGAVVDVTVDTAVYAVVDAKATARNGAREMIIIMGIKIIMEMVFKRGEIMGCAISVVKSVDGILPTPLDFIHKCDTVTFVLTAYHDYWKLPGKTDGVKTGTGSS